MTNGHRVALVYDAAYPFCKGGGERRFHDIAQELTARGATVELYAMRWWSGAERSRIVDGVTVHGLCRSRPLYTRSGRRSILAAVLFGLSCVKLLGRRFDVIDCCGFPYFSLFACRLVATLRRKPLVSTWHEVWGPRYWREYLGRLGVFGSWVERLAVRLPDRIIAVSATTGSRIRHELAYRGPIHLLPNGFDASIVDLVPPAPERADVVFAGRLIAPKQVDLLIRAIARLADGGLPASCVVVGDGPERARLTELAESLGVGPLVRFAGALAGHDEVLAVLKSARVLALPSSREGFGMVVLEANACGVPAITIGHAGNAATELIADGVNGWVVPGTEEGLVRAIARVLSGPPVPAGEDIARHVQAYAWSRLAESHALTDLYAPGTAPGARPLPPRRPAHGMETVC